MLVEKCGQPQVPGKKDLGNSNSSDQHHCQKKTIDNCAIVNCLERSQCEYTEAAVTNLSQLGISEHACTSPAFGKYKCDQTKSIELGDEYGEFVVTKA